VRLVEAVAKRLLRAVLVLFGISVMVFLIFFVTPGSDPAARLAGRGAPAETVARVRVEYGFDRPVPVQYLIMMRRLLWTQDLTSFVNRGQLVVPAVLRAVPTTLSLAFGAAILFTLAGLAIGVVAARAGQRVERLVLASGLLGVSIPAFWLGSLVAGLTQGRWHDSLFAWVPPLGTPAEGLLGWLRAMVLPWLTLAVLYAGIYGRVLRDGLVAALQQDYARTARAKGLGEARVVLRHALPNAIVPAVALLGLDLGALLGGGTVLVEVVFGLPGLGRLTYDALRSLDLATVMACVLYASAAVVAVNALAEVVQSVLDPAQRNS
jgi:peptide/nickel transport system permease protein